MSRLLVVVAALACAGGCGRPREIQGAKGDCPSWPEVAPLLAERCGDCHSAPSSEYRLDSYAGAVARRPDGTQRVRFGDLDSPLLHAARNTLADHPAAQVDALGVDRLERWVGACRLAASHAKVHPPGHLNPGDAEQFHGLALRATGYRTEPCLECHPDQGPSQLRGPACESCHPGGVDACDTCHGEQGEAAPPRDLSGQSLTDSPGVGAHAVHLRAGPWHPAYACDTCHRVPQRPQDEGHYRNADGEIDVVAAEVVLRARPGQVAHYDPVQRRCSGTWCHAPGLDDTAARNRTPRWDLVGHGEATCGTCHGLPPSAPHPDDARCRACHPAAFGVGVLLAATHADGVVQVGGGCTGCHGSAQNPAPPRDVLGNTDPSLPAVGAHQAHLGGHRLRGPVPCSECHQTFTSVQEPGHLDHGPRAVVFPQLPGVGTLARAQLAQPSYDPTSLSCASVYCHGNGTRLAADQAASLSRTPVWNGGAGQAACGTCHGVPPLHANHPADLALTDCAECHRQSIDPRGLLVLRRNAAGEITSTHLDGVVNVGPNP